MSSMKMPTLTEAQKDTLEGVISIGEIQQAVMNLSLGKVPGNFGLPSDFYRKFVIELAPRLQTVYQDVLLASFLKA